MNVIRIGFIACLLPILALRVEPGSCSHGSYPDLTWANRQTPALKQEVDNLLAATNTIREAKGRVLLQKDTKLMMAAQQYAELMTAHEEMSHTIGGLSLANKAQRVGYTYRSLRENIALNSTLDGRFVVDEQWMKSKGHRQNLLARDISQIGIGIAGPGKRTRRYYYCQIFGAPLSAGTQ